jgi:hypothetical protein
MMDKLARHIHERFYGNRELAATIYLHRDSLCVGGLAPPPINVLCRHVSHPNPHYS